MVKLLMPLATAVWMIDNTTLTFDQVARLCNMHALEVQGIADETVGQNIVGVDPTQTGQLTWAEIERCQKDPSADLVLIEDEIEAKPRTKGPRYTPVSKRQDKPSTIAWLLRYHPEFSDNQVCKLIGTTKPTINAIRERTHWNINQIQPQDPVSLGLCKQSELDELVQKNAHKVPKPETTEEKSAS